MITIHHALFGYSNGHHLISSSDSFDNKMLSILEKNSDLTGSSVVESFDGYLTGFLLSEKNVYVLSKTWFANEMPRPGCVWTHSLFIPLGISDSQLKGINFDSIFHRPDISELEWNDYYLKPIQIMNANTEMISENNAKPQYYYDLISILIGSSTPTVIAASSCAEYNCIFEEMIKGMGMSFIKDISFCTGSFALRFLSDSLFLIQIVPQKLPRGNWRSNVAVQMVYETSDKKLDFKNGYNKLDIITTVSFLTKMCQTKIDKNRMKYILDLFLDLRDKTINISLKNIIFNGLDIFGEDYPVGKILSEVFEHRFTNDYIDEQMLIEFCTLDAESLKLDEDFSCDFLNSVTNIIFVHGNALVFSIFNQLISSSLNKWGEIFINLIASKADNTLINYFINASDNVSLKAILSLNYKLALNSNIWTSSVETQCDVIKILSNYYPTENEKSFFADVIMLIYNTSQYDLSNRIYESFDKLAIEVFFLWATSANEIEKCISKWCNICRFNSLLSVKMLNKFEIRELFGCVINVLNPYDCELQTLSIDIWAAFYNRFCIDNDFSLRKSYSQFILPIILISQQDFPTELVEFAFTTVHSILARNEMEYSRWECLSKILPEVPLYSMWDRCKRLRKAGKIKNLKIDLKKYK